MARIKGPSRGPSRASKFLVVLVGGFLLGVFGSWLVMDTFRAVSNYFSQNTNSGGIAPPSPSSLKFIIYILFYCSLKILEWLKDKKNKVLV